MFTCLHFYKFVLCNFIVLRIEKFFEFVAGLVPGRRLPAAPPPPGQGSAGPFLEFRLPSQAELLHLGETHLTGQDPISGFQPPVLRAQPRIRYIQDSQDRRVQPHSHDPGGPCHRHLAKCAFLYDSPDGQKHSPGERGSLSQCLRPFLKQLVFWPCRSQSPCARVPLGVAEEGGAWISPGTGWEGHLLCWDANMPDAASLEAHGAVCPVRGPLSPGRPLLVL